MAITKSLYPPIIDSYLPAFDFEDTEFKIYFAISDFNSFDEIGNAHITIYDSVKNLNIVGNSSGIIFRRKDEIYYDYDEKMYYVIISKSELKPDYETNRTYKVQIRFGESDTDFTGLGEKTRYSSLVSKLNNNYFNEMKTYQYSYNRTNNDSNNTSETNQVEAEVTEYVIPNEILGINFDTVRTASHLAKLRTLSATASKKSLYQRMSDSMLPYLKAREHFEKYGIGGRPVRNMNDSALLLLDTENSLLDDFLSLEESENGDGTTEIQKHSYEFCYLVPAIDAETGKQITTVKEGNPLYNVYKYSYLIKEVIIPSYQTKTIVLQYLYDPANITTFNYFDINRLKGRPASDIESVSKTDILNNPENFCAVTKTSSDAFTYYVDSHGYLYEYNIEDRENSDYVQRLTESNVNDLNFSFTKRVLDTNGTTIIETDELIEGSLEESDKSAFIRDCNNYFQLISSFNVIINSSDYVYKTRHSRYKEYGSIDLKILEKKVISYYYDFVLNYYGWSVQNMLTVTESGDGGEGEEDKPDDDPTSDLDKQATEFDSWYNGDALTIAFKDDNDEEQVIEFTDEDNIAKAATREKLDLCWKYFNEKNYFQDNDLLVNLRYIQLVQSYIAWLKAQKDKEYFGNQALRINTDYNIRGKKARQSRDSVFNTHIATVRNANRSISMNLLKYSNYVAQNIGGTVLPTANSGDNNRICYDYHGNIIVELVDKNNAIADINVTVLGDSCLAVEADGVTSGIPSPKITTEAGKTYFDSINQTTINKTPGTFNINTLVTHKTEDGEVDYLEDGSINYVKYDKPLISFSDFTDVPFPYEDNGDDDSRNWGEELIINQTISAAKQQEAKDTYLHDTGSCLLKNSKGQLIFKTDYDYKTPSPGPALIRPRNRQEILAAQEKGFNLNNCIYSFTGFVKPKFNFWVIMPDKTFDHKQAIKEQDQNKIKVIDRCCFIDNYGQDIIAPYAGKLWYEGYGWDPKSKKFTDKYAPNNFKPSKQIGRIQTSFTDDDFKYVEDEHGGHYEFIAKHIEYEFANRAVNKSYVPEAIFEANKSDYPYLKFTREFDLPWGEKFIHWNMTGERDPVTHLPTGVGIRRYDYEKAICYITKECANTAKAMISKMIYEDNYYFYKHEGRKCSYEEAVAKAEAAAAKYDATKDKNYKTYYNQAINDFAFSPEDAKEFAINQVRSDYIGKKTTEYYEYTDKEAQTKAKEDQTLYNNNYTVVNIQTTNPSMVVDTYKWYYDTYDEQELMYDVLPVYPDLVKPYSDNASCFVKDVKEVLDNDLLYPAVYAATNNKQAIINNLMKKNLSSYLLNKHKLHVVRYIRNLERVYNTIKFKIFNRFGDYFDDAPAHNSVESHLIKDNKNRNNFYILENNNYISDPINDKTNISHPFTEYIYATLFKNNSTDIIWGQERDKSGKAIYECPVYNKQGEITGFKKTTSATYKDPVTGKVYDSVAMMTPIGLDRIHSYKINEYKNISVDKINGELNKVEKNYVTQSNTLLKNIQTAINNKKKNVTASEKKVVAELQKVIDVEVARQGDLAKLRVDHPDDYKEFDDRLDELSKLYEAIEVFYKARMNDFSNQKGQSIAQGLVDGLVKEELQKLAFTQIEEYNASKLKEYNAVTSQVSACGGNYPQLVIKEFGNITLKGETEPREIKIYEISYGTGAVTFGTIPTSLSNYRQAQSSVQKSYALSLYNIIKQVKNIFSLGDQEVFKSITTPTSNFNNYIIDNCKLFALDGGAIIDAISNVSLEYPSTSWYNEFIDSFSEWSTVCFIKPIQLPIFNILNFDNSISNSYSVNIFDNRIITFNGLYKTNTEVDNAEYLSTYRFDLKDINGNILLSSGNLPCRRDEEIALEYTPYYEFKEDEIYQIQLSILTENLYESSVNYYFKIYTNKEDIIPFNICMTEDTNEARVVFELTGSEDIEDSIYHKYLIQRTDEDTNFSVWEDILSYTCNDDFYDSIYDEETNTYIRQLKKEPIKLFDYAIESDKIYKYRIIDKNEDSFIIKEIENKDSKKDKFISVNFEYYYLLADNKQLNIKFNNKMGSFKYVTSETKFDPIDSKYPYIIKNGNLFYRTFPISCIISLKADENNIFCNEINKDIKVSNIFVGQRNDVAREKIFRDYVYDYLYNNKYFLFKSPTEGNIIIKLMDISFAPIESLGREIYTMNATAYECYDVNLHNIFDLDIARIDEKEIQIKDLDIYISSDKKVLLSEMPIAENDETSIDITDSIRSNFVQIGNNYYVTDGDKKKLVYDISAEFIFINKKIETEETEDGEEPDVYNPNPFVAINIGGNDIYVKTNTAEDPYNIGSLYSYFDIASHDLNNNITISGYEDLDLDKSYMNIKYKVKPADDYEVKTEKKYTTRTHIERIITINNLYDYMLYDISTDTYKLSVTEILNQLSDTLQLYQNNQPVVDINVKDINSVHLMWDGLIENLNIEGAGYVIPEEHYDDLILHDNGNGGCLYIYYTEEKGVL